LLLAYRETADWERTQQVIQELDRRGMELNTGTFNLVLDCATRVLFQPHLRPSTCVDVKHLALVHR
jgi:hypothetical protein